MHEICVLKVPFRLFLINCNMKLEIKFWFLFLFRILDIKHKTKCFFDFENNRTLKFKFEVRFSFFILTWKRGHPHSTYAQRGRGEVKSNVYDYVQGGRGELQGCSRTQKKSFLDRKISKLLFLFKRSYYHAIFYCV